CNGGSALPGLGALDGLDARPGLTVLGARGGASEGAGATTEGSGGCGAAVAVITGADAVGAGFGIAVRAPGFVPLLGATAETTRSTPASAAQSVRDDPAGFGEGALGTAFAGGNAE